jgi:hypothetical protein
MELVALGSNSPQRDYIGRLLVDAGSMTRSELLRVIATLGWLVAIAIAGTDRRIIRTLQRATALSPDTAITIRPSRLTRWRLARLQRRGAVTAVGPDRFYLNARDYSAFRQVRRRIVLTVLAVSLSLLAVALWMSP